MNSFLFAVNAVLPIVLLVAIGYALRRAGILNTHVAKAVNKLVFRLLLPCMLFLNVYKIDSIASIGFGYIWFSAAAILVIFAVGIPLCRLITKQNDQRGVVLQAIFRSNFSLIGIPLATSLFGEEGGAVATLLSAFSIPLFNVLAVTCLTIFVDGEKFNLKKILLGIVKNPLILSIALGGVFLGIRAILEKHGIAFRFSDIKPVYSVLEQLSRAATPIALLMLGAEFELSAIPKLKKQIILATLMRVLAVPAAVLTVAYLVGGFTGAHFASFVALFASPVAVSSVPMAQEMGSDSELAGQLVVWTTVASAFTIFLFSFVLKSAGIF
ncbi:MAG: AEC family transporter [Clostridia bacterium]|nr:AEC family transporter [Clostridia bacterium]